MSDEQLDRARSVLLFWVDGPPVPYVRQSQRDKWEPRPAVLKYRAWADTIRHTLRPMMLGGPDLPELPCIGPVHLSCIFDLPIPASWAKWRREEALAGKGWPTGGGTGDADNLFKGVADSLNKLAYLDDAQVVSAVSIKRYGESPGVLIGLDFDGTPWVQRYADHLTQMLEAGLKGSRVMEMKRSARRRLDS